MEYFIEYGVFLAKAITWLVAIFLVVTLLVAAGQRSRRQSPRGHLVVTHLNKEIDGFRQSLQQVILDRFAFKRTVKEQKRQDKLETRRQRSSDDTAARRRRVYVLRFEGDLEASNVESLRQEVTAVLTMAEPQDEVMVALESPGGMVHAYGLASSQLLRLREQELALTVCVDKVAASGGYMMACVANRLLAAPFAILGSVGVLVQMPNIHRLLKKHDVDVELITAGEYKRTMTPLTEVTEKGREKVREEVEEMHELFKSWVKQYRPVLDIDEVATGETWVGLQALEKNLIDGISTSDSYILERCADSDVYEVRYEIRMPLRDRFGTSIHLVLDKTLLKWWQRLMQQRLI